MIFSSNKKINKKKNRLTAFYTKPMEYIQLKADQNGFATNVALTLLVHVFHLPAKPNCLELI